MFLPADIEIPITEQTETIMGGNYELKTITAFFLILQMLKSRIVSGFFDNSVFKYVQLLSAVFGTLYAATQLFGLISRWAVTLE